MAWENDLDAADRLSQEQIKFHQLHRTEIPIAGREIAKQLVKWAKIEGGAGEGEQSMVPNGMAQRIATILRPAKIMCVYGGAERQTLRGGDGNEGRKSFKN